MKRFLLLGLCLLLVGCGIYRPNTTITEVNVHTGTKGITAKFLEQSPPAITYANTPLSLSYELANEGASDVTDGVVSIGIEDDFLKLEGDRIRLFKLDGRSTVNPQGESQIFSAQLRAKDLPPQTETATTTIALNVCDTYTTDAELTMCVDTDVFNRVRTKPCKSAAVSPGSQGAPVAVSKIEPTYTADADPSRIRAAYLITIRNAGSGQLFEADKSLEACTPQALGKNSWNVASVKAFLGDQQLDCSPKKPNYGGSEGYLQLINGEDFVRCELPGGVPKTAGTYTSTMTVEVTYGYTFTLTKQVQIKRLT
ncbi:MAG TPA: hypothetical protein VLJ21_01140 [Candidatus Binatia bacterium]|nr:hypothetical protein [Candidatus Binatia bacterium]